MVNAGQSTPPFVFKENQLSVMLGRPAGEIERGETLIDQPLPTEVPAGVPSMLLLRRPDLIEAEQNVVAANAHIGVAKSAYFPQIGLTASGGVARKQRSPPAKCGLPRPSPASPAA